LNRLKSELESTILLFPLGRAELESGQEAALATATKRVNDLIARTGQNSAVQIDVIGHTDTAGVEAANLPLSRQRADRVLRILLRSGAKASYFHPRGVGTTEPVKNEETEDGRRLNRSVTFHVNFTTPSASGAN
jgi:outer membrane protein OmpA-like peptidoglycan-associated protein